MGSFESTYKGVKIAVITGDITAQEVDAIVNPANSLMIMAVSYTHLTLPTKRIV